MARAVRYLRPFWLFYGGKWRAVPRYPMPKYGTIVEPFAGAAGYSTRYHSRLVTLNDKDPQIASLWRWLVLVGPEQILALPDLEVGQTTDDLEVCSEARALIGFWLKPAQSVPGKSPSSWYRDAAAHHLVWGERVRQRIAQQVSKIRHWNVSCGSYDDLPNIEATWFIDPPYQEAGKHYRHGSKGINYQHLAAFCRSRKGQVIVCENAGATWLPFEPFARIQAATTKAGSKTSSEAVWFQPAPLRLL